MFQRLVVDYSSVHRNTDQKKKGISYVCTCYSSLLLLVLIYLVLRAGKTDVDCVIQRSLAILASPMFIVASPLRRMLFNNYTLSGALYGWMTRDDDTVLNIICIAEGQEVGQALLQTGSMRPLSRAASFAASYSSTGKDPGPKRLDVLAIHESHMFIVNQNGR